MIPQLAIPTRKLGTTIAPVDDCVGVRPLLEEEIPDDAGFVMESVLVAEVIIELESEVATELEPELTSIEEDLLIDKVVVADWVAGPRTAGAFRQFR
jgi:hypothetical protein